MNNSLRFCLVLHNHQPIGNFDHVFEQAYCESYLPFLEVFEGYSDLQLSLHTSGPLIEWLDTHHPEYLDRLAKLVQAGRIEIIGGAFYEPILTMIPARDRRGQLLAFRNWLEERLAARVRGAWIPERVWEQNLTSDLNRSGVLYTVLDDFHFRNAGLKDEQLVGSYLTEDEGRTLSIFPGSERLRYLIPFGQPEATLDYLRQIAERHPGAVIVFGDDGEKFGTWPETHQHCYQDGWLVRFLDALTAHRGWLKTTTLGEAFDSVPPVGKIYLPDGSYREMTEWALPVRQQMDYEDMVREMRDDPRWERIQPFVRGGYWRNFRVKYPEANEMYSRMMMVSRRLEEAEGRTDDAPELEAARRELYRSQCNCSYWHGAFGGIYLPHLRNAVYHHLIAADNLLDQLLGEAADQVRIEQDDYDFDARPEMQLVNNRLMALIDPADGGQMYELDVRSICHNLLATFTRRPEAYHRNVVARPQDGGSDCASIHDRVVFKQPGLERELRYDLEPRKSLIDHFFDNDVSLTAIQRGEAMERGDFSSGGYTARLRRSSDRVQALLSREGNAWGIPLTLTKGVKLVPDSSTLEIAYQIEGVPPDAELHFAIEFNFAGLPAEAEDRFFYQGDRSDSLGHLGTPLDLLEIRQLGLVDQWLGIDVRLRSSQPGGFWAFPVAAISQSEGGIERIHQSVVVMPHWRIRGSRDGRWSVTLQLDLDTSVAESRRGSDAEAPLAATAVGA